MEMQAPLGPAFSAGESVGSSVGQPKIFFGTLWKPPCRGQSSRSSANASLSNASANPTENRGYKEQLSSSWASRTTPREQVKTRHLPCLLGFLWQAFLHVIGVRRL